MISTSRKPNCVITYSLLNYHVYSRMGNLILKRVQFSQLGTLQHLASGFNFHIGPMHERMLVM